MRRCVEDDFWYVGLRVEISFGGYFTRLTISIDQYRAITASTLECEMIFKR